LAQIKRRGWQMRKRGVVVAVVLAVSLVVVWTVPAQANHQWSNYHWSQQSSPLTVSLIDSTTSPWSSMLTTASNDWNASSALNTQLSNGDSSASTRSACDPVQNKVRVCNYNYGNTGWLGLAQIWLYLGKGHHIAQGVVEANDYYFGSSSYTYNNTNEQLHVICQEVGHTIGLDHQDESGASLNTCMDYFHNTSTSTLSTHPNQGDYDELLCIYDPSKSGQTITSTISVPGDGSYTHTCKGTGHLDGSKPRGGPGGGPPPNHSRNDTVTVSRVGAFSVVAFIYWAD
jgi:hypothetical protein